MVFPSARYLRISIQMSIDNLIKRTNGVTDADREQLHAEVSSARLRLSSATQLFERLSLLWNHGLISRARSLS